MMINTLFKRTSPVFLLLALMLFSTLPGAAQGAQSITKFVLINARDDVIIEEMTAVYNINCADLGTIVLNIRAYTSPGTVGSVRFALDANPNYNIENSQPYTLAGNNGSDYNGWKPTNGVHTVMATPYTGSNATGTAGTPLSVQIIAEECVEPSPTPTSTATDVLPTATPTPIPPTETPTLEPTATATDVSATTTPTLEATSTATTVPPTPTATQVAEIELLTNGGFETDADDNKVPDGWTLQNNSKDKRKCNPVSPPKVIAHEGSCAFQFKSLPGENSKLKQNISPTAGAGDVLSLAGFVNSKGSVNASVKVRVKYSDTSGEKGKITVTIKTPLSVYTAFSDLSAELVYTLTGAVQKIKVVVNNKSTAGKVRFDALSLMLTDNTEALIPLP